MSMNICPVHVLLYIGVFVCIHTHTYTYTDFVDWQLIRIGIQKQREKEKEEKKNNHSVGCEQREWGTISTKNVSACTRENAAD